MAIDNWQVNEGVRWWQTRMSSSKGDALTVKQLACYMVTGGADLLPFSLCLNCLLLMQGSQCENRYDHWRISEIVL